MPNYLESLAGGLRNAAGILNPEVQRETFAADERTNQMQIAEAFRRQNMVQQHLLQQATPQAQIASLHLQNETEFRKAVAEAQGDETKIASAAMQFKPELAASMINAKEQRAARVEAAAQQLEYKRDQLETQKELALAKMTDQRQRDEFERSYKTQKLALDTQLGDMKMQVMQGSQQLRAMQIATMGDAAQRKAAEAQDKALAKLKEGTDKSAKQLGSALEKAGIPTTDAVMNAAEKAVSDDTTLQYLTGPKSILPDWTQPADIRQARQDIQKLFNITLKDRSGAAVTNQELERLKQEFGSGVFKTPVQLRGAVESARNIVNSHVQGIAASYGSGALKAYNDNLEELGGKPLLSTPARRAGDKGNDPLGIR